MRDDQASTILLDPARQDPLALSPELAGASAEQEGGTEDLLPKVTPLDYVQLRLLAECAGGAVSPAGATDAPAQFYFRKELDEATLTEKDELHRMAPNTTLQATDILIPTRDPGRFPDNGIRLEVDATGEPGGYRLRDAGIADALFWSDAAVQKFVFPYVASCGGDTAAAMLETLQHAWNHYPNSVVVYALAHLISSVPGERLTMDRSVGVAFRYTDPREGQPVGLHIVTLTDFMTAIGENKLVAGSTNPPPVPFRLVDTGLTTALPGYVQLRAMAEWACSINDVPQYFVFPASGSGGFKVWGQDDLDLTTLDPADIVVPAFTPTVPDKRPVLHGVWFQPAETSLVGNLATRGDALFWSTAAIEQFVIPYYASKGGMESLPDLSEIAAEWSAGESLEGQTLYALIHLPHSEWTEVIVEQGIVKVEVDGDPMPPTAGTSAAKRLITRLEPKAQLGMVTRQMPAADRGAAALSGRPRRP